MRRPFLLLLLQLLQGFSIKYKKIKKVVSRAQGVKVRYTHTYSMGGFIVTLVTPCTK